MALPVTIPNQFANATSSIPLSQLDTNFNTLSNAVNGINSGAETLANLVATTANVTTGNITTVNATTVDTTNIEVTNIKAKDGTASATIADSTGVMTVSTQFNVDNLRLDGNAITSTDTNGNIDLTPNGTGEVNISKVDIDAGTIDGVVIGGSTADAASFTTLTVNSNNISADNSLGFRNRIINGDMRIDQRNAGAAVTTSASFPVDRFEMINTTDGAFSAQQDSSAPVGFVNSVKVTTTTADGTLTTTQVLVAQQRIEGNNVADLGWGTANAKTVTLSFWVRSSLTGTFGGALNNHGFNRSYPFTYTISSADTWEYKTVTVPGDTTGTWLTTTSTGIRIAFGLGAGPDRSGTAGAWAGASYVSATGAVSVIGTLNATWYITGVQLEVGSVATPFERRPFGTELQLCQRYFEKSYELAVSLGQSTNTSKGSFVTGAAANTFWRWSQNFRVSKRTAPTFTIYSTTGASGNVRLNNASDLAVTTEDAGENAASIYVSRNASVGDFFWWQWAASAEL